MQQTLLRYLPILLLTLAWEAGARLGLGAALALPPPSDVLAAFVDLVRDGDLVTNGAASLYRAGVGLALAFILLVSAELIVSERGFGYLIGFLGDNGSYDAMFAVVLTVAFLGFAADRAYHALTARVLAWRE